MRALVSLSAIALGGMALGGCAGARHHDDVVAGKKLFVARCGACHTLSRAGTTGSAGPNLDAAFKQSRLDGFGSATIAGIVRGQILNPGLGGGMPKAVVKGQQARDVAAYVGMVAALGGQDTGALANAVHKPGTGPAAVEKGGVLEIDAEPTGQLSYVTRKAEGTAGTVVIKSKNASAIGHDIALQQGTGGPILGKGSVVSGGSVSQFSVKLKPGTYTFFCTVPGHRAGGMLGTLTVK